MKKADFIPEESRKRIGEMISSVDSVVGIDAKEAHSACRATRYRLPRYAA